MNRLALAVLLILGVIAVLWVAPALRRFAHQLQGHDVAGVRDLKSLCHAEGSAR